MPSARACPGLAIGPDDDHLTVFHPLAGTSYNLQVSSINEELVVRRIEKIVGDHDGVRERFLAVWRLLADELAAEDASFDLLPADTRVPDHTIWHHLNITAGLKAALSGPHGANRFSFRLGPVQTFIESAQSVRDLWSGSMILSWLVFQGLMPIIERYGPTAIVYPALQGIPLLDLWLRRAASIPVAQPTTEALLSPCLPNRFLATVPYQSNSDGQTPLAEECVERVRSAWRRLTDAVRRSLDAALRREGVDLSKWARRWDEQVDEFLEIHTTTIS